MGNVRNVPTFVGPRLMKAGPRFTRNAGDLRLRRAAAIGVAAVAALSLLLIAGCKHPMDNMSAYLRNKQLNDAVIDYNKYVRWQEWDQASAFVKTADQAAFKQKMEDAEESFRITEYEIKDTRPGAEAKSAAARVLYRYYWLPSIREEKLTVLQRWIWSTDERRWVVDTPFVLPARRIAKARPAASARSDKSGEE